MQIAAQAAFPSACPGGTRGCVRCATLLTLSERDGLPGPGQGGQTMTTTVLVADDAPDLRESVRDILEAEQYGVLEAQNGIEALALPHATAPPLVVLLDLQMPQLDGAGVLRVVAPSKQLAPRNHYILMTAHRRSLPLASA